MRRIAGRVEETERVARDDPEDGLVVVEAQIAGDLGGSRLALADDELRRVDRCDPRARATFGIYRNSDRFIYQRENF